MRQFTYNRASSVEQAIDQLQQAGQGEIRLLAGGTDLLPLMKGNIIAPNELLDIKRMDLPSGIKADAGGISIGALTTLSEIEKDAAIAKQFPVLAEAAGLAATPQLRNMATVAGNLLQRPRCWYFRNDLFNCWLKGGDECPALEGQNEFHALFHEGSCCAVHPSDMASALLALEAEVKLRGPEGVRTLPIADFFAMPTESRRRETTMAEDELLLSVQLPSLPTDTRSTYLKAMDRKVWAFALVGVAALMRIEQNRIKEVRIVLSGVAPVPWRATEAESHLQGKEASDDLFAEAAEIALSEAVSLGHNDYKIPLTQKLIQRALTALAANSG